MAGAFLLQDWITIQGPNTTSTFTQPEQEYADLAAFQDVVAFVEVSNVSNSPNLEFQTSPTKDDVLFKQMDTSVSFVPAVGVTPKVMRYSAMTVPLARYLRWKITLAGVAGWSITFRVWISPNLS